MTDWENIAAQITSLLEEGTIAKSRCGGGLLRVLRPLVEAGVIVEERTGPGRRLVVQDAGALREFSQRQFPDAPVTADMGSRAVGVARFRDSKTFASDTPEIVVLRAWREDALLKEGQAIEAALATATHGAFSFLLKSGADYSLRGLCALVENPAVFGQFERLRLPVGLVIYGHGRASNRLIAWLAGKHAPEFSLLHLPDYDPVGLDEFERLRARLGPRVCLHVPNDVEQRFAQFSKPSLLDSSRCRAILAGLRRTGPPEVQRVLDLINRHNAGLEQEALFL